MKTIEKSRELFEKAKTLAPGGVHSPVRAFGSVGGTPVFFTRGKGGHCIDADGNDYLDFCQSWGPLILGHADETVVEAVRKAAVDGLSFGACHDKEVALAESVLRAFPTYDRVRFVSSGTEAVMTAISSGSWNYRALTDRQIRRRVPWPFRQPVGESRERSSDFRCVFEWRRTRRTRRFDVGFAAG